MPGMQEAWRSSTKSRPSWPTRLAASRPALVRLHDGHLPACPVLVNAVDSWLTLLTNRQERRPPSSLEQASLVASPVCCSMHVTVQGADMAAVAAGQMSNGGLHLLPYRP